jgi:hypothetical protein
MAIIWHLFNQPAIGVADNGIYAHRANVKADIEFEFRHLKFLLQREKKVNKYNIKSPSVKALTEGLSVMIPDDSGFFVCPTAIFDFKIW